MKYSRAEVHSKAHKIPDLKFEQQSLTSFAGLIVFQQLFKALGFRGQLRGCCRHVKGRRVYGLATVFFQLIIHILLGYREIRDVAYYGHDPLVKRVLGLNQVPDPATVSRTLKDADEQSIHNLRGFLRDMIFERLKTLLLSRITLDFDGTVQSTGRFAEGTAVGFNKKKKGQRSYYPLFCTIAQTGQVLDFLHRPGNVHDSNGAKAFILACIQAVQQMAPGAQIEVRIDSALFSDAMVTALDKRLIQFTISVPFERLPKLKHLIEARKRWWRHNRERSYWSVHIDFTNCKPSMEQEILRVRLGGRTRDRVVAA